MKLNKKLLCYETLAVLSGCIGCIILAVFIVTIIFSKTALMLDLIWLTSSCVLLCIYMYSNKKVTKLQAKWDYENRR